MKTPRWPRAIACNIAASAAVSSAMYFASAEPLVAVGIFVVGFGIGCALVAVFRGWARG